MFYVGVKGGIEYAGWSADQSMDSLALPENWLEITRERTLRMVEEIRGGRVEILPADRDSCRFCDAKDICRDRSGRGRADGTGGGRMSDVSFTPDQLDAIDVAKRHLDACVVAGPGSGKTTVLVEYFRQLVGAGVDPLRILAITFTEKAAGNMRKKLAQAFQQQPETRANLERAWVSTVHGFCARLLRENAVFAGVDPEFRVLDATRILAHAAGIHARRHRRAVSSNTAKRCAG